MPSPLRAAACAALALGAAVCLQGCGTRRVEPPQQHRAAAKQVAPPAPEPKESPSASAEAEAAAQRAKAERKVKKERPELPTRPPGPDCPAMSFEGASGPILVEESNAGELPAVRCPDDTEYRGPRIECSWVDRVCHVRGSDDAVVPELCHVQYNFTLEGKGLTSWPEGVSPRLVSSKRRVLQTLEYKRGKRNTSALPSALSPEHIPCKGESYTDLDFEHAQINRTNPPYSEDNPWIKHFGGISVFNDQEVDLRISHVGSAEAPGDVWLDGNSSATGRININHSNASELRFQFFESGTETPIVLSKVFLTIFDLDDGEGGLANKRVAAAGVYEYFVSRSTSLEVNKTEDDKYLFFSRGSEEQKPEEPTVTDIWLSSLKRTVVFVFRDASEFTITVQASPLPNGQVLEFAGWSELVDQGTRVMLKRKKVIKRFLEHPAGSQKKAEDVPLVRQPSFALPLTLAAACALAATVGGAALGLQRWRRCPDDCRRPSQPPAPASDRPQAAKALEQDQGDASGAMVQALLRPAHEE